MRRSKAPSALSKSKRVCVNSITNNEPEEKYGSDPEDEQYLKWGSRENTKGAENEFFDKNKRYFNVVWRNLSTKKHKTWAGDGTLEVNVLKLKAVLKDDTGKYMGSTTRFKISELCEDFQMVVSGKEIEIQNEIKDEEEIYELRKRVIKNRNWGAEEWVPPEEQAEEAKKPKGGFYFKPVLHLNSPKLPGSVATFKETIRKSNIEALNWGTAGRSQNNLNGWQLNEKSDKKNNIREIDSNVPKRNSKEITHGVSTDGNTRHGQSCKISEFICFVKPSELQQYLFQQINEFYTDYKNKFDNEQLKSLNIEHVLQQICNHPSFIKHIPSTNNLVEFLTPFLPTWSEMGPFDSGKLEFVQYYIQPSGGRQTKNILILAKSSNVVNMLQGLCDFMNIKIFKLCSTDSKDTKKQLWNEYLCTSEEDNLRILLTSSLLDLNDCDSNLDKQTIFVFEDWLSTMNELKTIKDLQDVKVYYLVTAFSIEECLILANSPNCRDNLTVEEILNLYNTDFDDTLCYVHSKIQCHCFESMKSDSLDNEDRSCLKSWHHLAVPFEEQFLKVWHIF